ncbi:MAG: tyrosine-type recombinase/integrase, partial [Planctomycetota bacterium]
LRWAVELELLERAPVVKVTIEDRPRSRAMTLEEFERMLRVAEQIEGEGPQLHRLLRGLWHSGLRIGEIAALSWNADASIRLEDSGKYPVVSMDAAANKSRRNRVRPILPEFWAICCESPIRKGLVFPVFDASGQRLGSGRLSELIARVGKAACVITNWQRGKSASAHDIRRAFAVRMDGRLTLAELQKWMGHSDVSTTLTYYHTADAEALASKLWRAGAGGAAGGAEGEAANRPDKGR